LIPPLTAKRRFWIRIGSITAGLLAVVFFNLVPLQFMDADISVILVDWRTTVNADHSVTKENHWVSVQAFMWLAFFAGLGELVDSQVRGSIRGLAPENRDASRGRAHHADIGETGPPLHQGAQHGT
jgi:hypothetical protein